MLLGPILDGRADVVYGSRFLGGPQRVHYFWHYCGNKFLTLLSDIFTNLKLSDMETCYKAFRKEVWLGSSSNQTVLASSLKLRRRSPKEIGASTKFRFPTMAAHTKKERKLPGKMASPPSGAFSATSSATKPKPSHRPHTRADAFASTSTPT